VVQVQGHRADHDADRNVHDLVKVAFEDALELISINEKLLRNYVNHSLNKL